VEEKKKIMGARLAETQGGNSVVVVDFDIPFMSLVKLILKIAVALVPLAIIVVISWFLIGAIVINL
jgi:hypothetical protein